MGGRGAATYYPTLSVPHGGKMGVWKLTRKNVRLNSPIKMWKLSQLPNSIAAVRGIHCPNAAICVLYSYSSKVLIWRGVKFLKIKWKHSAAEQIHRFAPGPSNRRGPSRSCASAGGSGGKAKTRGTPIIKYLPRMAKDSYLAQIRVEIQLQMSQDKKKKIL